MSMSTWFGVVAGIAVLLTFLSRRTHDLLLRIGASLCWLAMLVYLLVGGDANLSISNPWIQVLAFALFVMVIVPLTWQMKTDIRHEASIRGKGGTTGQSESYTLFEKKPKKKKLSTSERQAEYKETLRGKTRRK